MKCFNDPRRSDVKIIVGLNNIFTHTVILEEYSEYFSRGFSSSIPFGIKDNGITTFTFKDIAWDVAYQVFAHMYGHSFEITTTLDATKIYEFCDYLQYEKGKKDVKLLCSDTPNLDMVLPNKQLQTFNIDDYIEEEYQKYKRECEEMFKEPYSTSKLDEFKKSLLRDKQFFLKTINEFIRVIKDAYTQKKTTATIMVEAWGPDHSSDEGVMLKKALDYLSYTLNKKGYTYTTDIRTHEVIDVFEGRCSVGQNIITISL